VGKHQPIPTKNTRVVYQFGIFCWYWLVFSWYFTNQYQRKTWLVHFGIKILAGTPYPLPKGGVGPLFDALSPLCRKNDFPQTFSKKELTELSKKSSRQILQ
jgi:hypothetical protein